MKSAHNRFARLLIAILPLWSCTEEKVPEPFQPKNHHEAYFHSLTQAGLEGSALGGDWVEAAQKALASPIRVNPPFEEAFYFDSRAAVAQGYRFAAKRGQVIEVDVDDISMDTGIRPQLFIDLFRVNENDVSGRHVATADSTELILGFQSRRDAEYILRIQPELLRGGNFKVTIKKVPSLAFPVAGKNSQAIGSYFGDPRDGGKREHHGVDIFALRHTPILAPVKAYVRFVGVRGLGGNVVWLRDSKGHSLYFAHLQEQWVKGGTWVNPGDTIGTVGNSGNARSTPPHLHFGIYSSGPVDPLHFIKETNTEAIPLQMDQRFLGAMARVLHEVTLSPFPGGDQTDTLKALTIARVVGATGMLLRIETPEGEEGYIDGKKAELAYSPVDEISTPEPTPIYNKPGEKAFEIGLTMEGEVVKVFGTFKDYTFIQTSQGQSGWLSPISMASTASAGGGG